MSGRTARTGFQFQDRYLLLRVLRAAGECFDKAWKCGANDANEALFRLPFKFGLEASTAVANDEAEIDWDVLVQQEGELEFAEVKSGAISKDDRIAFWRRLRHELASAKDTSPILIPVLVVDPTKAGDLSKWQELASAAIAYAGAAPANGPQGSVLTTGELLNEALWELCRVDVSNDRDAPAVAFDFARAALSRFRLDSHAGSQLEAEVNHCLEVLFPGGLTDTQHSLLLGWLSCRATTQYSARRLFTVHELLAEIGILQDAISIGPTVLREWRELWNEVPQRVRTRTRPQLGELGASIDAAQIQPDAVQALISNNNRGLVILGQGGAGKSTFLAQAAEAAERRTEVVLHCGADDVTTDELEVLFKAFRFRAALTALRKPSTQACLFVDGLDEAEPSLRKRWAQFVVRLNAIPNTRVCVSIRDETWRTDGDVRAQLETWPSISLGQWPEKLVRDLLAPTHYHDVLPLAVVELLRTPILLDLFWRTFVEGVSTNVSRASRLQTRHNLLSAFWEGRLLQSPRHAGLRDKVSRFATVFSHVAQSVGPFLESSLDSEAVHVLLSEGVLVREGRLQPRLRFRHPLLRDFALAQWCLGATAPHEAAQSWLSINGGLQRHGALRATFEALSDPNASADYPHSTLVSFLHALARESPSAAKQVAHVLGTWYPADGLNPATWPPELQHSLPAEFGRELVAAARLDVNGYWAAPLEHWPDEAAWLDEDFPEEVWRYASLLLEKSKSKVHDSAFCEQIRQAARTLRRLCQIERFRGCFAKHDHWLKMHAFRCVIPTLPEEATLVWIEREMSQMNWRTRPFLLEQLVHLASVSEARTAHLYSQIIGLSTVDGHHVLEASSWRVVQNHWALEWSLAGEDGHRSLIKEYPTEFMPVALELAEALWEHKHVERQESHRETIEFMTQFDARWADANSEEREREKKSRLGELIDDAPDWSYWRSLPREDNYECCLRAIHDCAKTQIKSSPVAFLSTAAPRMKASRLGTVQSILLDLLLAQKDQVGIVPYLSECLLDGRLYQISGLRYWLEQGLMVAWSSYNAVAKAKVLENISDVRTSSHLDGEQDEKRLLARIPTQDLPEALRGVRPKDGDPTFRPSSRPTCSSDELGTEWIPTGNCDRDDEAATQIGEWPGEFDREILKRFYHATKHLSRKEAAKEELREKIPIAIQTAAAFAPQLRSHSHLLADRDRFWIWRALTVMLDCYRKLHGDESMEQPPPPELVRDCAELALVALVQGPGELKGKLPEHGIWSGHPESEWTHALALADAVLTWPPVMDDGVIQQRFLAVLETAFDTGQPLVQLVCTTTVRPWHWFRDEARRQLHDRLVWNTPKHGSVLSWSLARTSNHADGERARVYRLLLNRGRIQDAENLADRLGQYIGLWSMHVFVDGKRSAVADLARETVSSPGAFRLLQDAACCREFLGSLVFGMKEQAKKMNTHAELANDYGDWNFKAWQSLRGHKKRRKGSSGVVLHATHWLEKKDGNQSDRAALKPWWQSIQAMLECVVREGGRADCFTLFFNLRDGDYNDLTSPEELMRLVEPFVERIVTGTTAQSLDLDEINPEQDEHTSWRQCAGYAAEAIDSLRKDGSLRTDLQRDQAHRLLSRLASEPIRSPKAVEALHRLQNE